MIQKLWLRRWKAYDSLDLVVPAGTTFVVAHNGTGKSSIVQALHFAFFGSPTLLGSSAQVTSAVRGHEGAIATVGCRVIIGSKEIVLERSVERTSTTPKIRTSVHIDGASASEADWMALLGSETGVDAVQLGLLAFVPEGETISVADAGLSIVAMLSSVFGVDRLKRFSDEFEQQARRLNRGTDALRKSLRDVPSSYDIQRSAQLKNQLHELEARIASLRSSLAGSERRLVLRADWAEFHQSKRAFEEANADEQHQVRSLVRRAAEILPDPYFADFEVSDRDDLNLAITRISASRESMIRNWAKIEAQRELALSYLDMLRTAKPVCPLCRQPLSAEGARHARSENEATLRDAESELASIERPIGELGLIIDEMNSVARRPELVPPPKAPREGFDEPINDTSVDVDMARAALEEATEARTALLNELKVIEQIERQRQHNLSLSTQLFDGYRAAERAQLCATTMRMLADAISRERISPLAAELQKRWSQLGQASSLTMDDSGALAMEEAGYTVPYSGFSGGQRTLAQIAIRLLALQMATRSPFLVLDEPLEHLDPRNRHGLATLLGQVTRESTRLRQVIVTTYEESVTRRLSSVPAEAFSFDELTDDIPVHVVRILPSESGSDEA